MRDELAAVAHLKALFSDSNHDSKRDAKHGEAGSSADGELGIGDDCATVDDAPGTLVWTIDEQAENTHFRRDWLSWKDVGYRSFIAAASDIAAMGGKATHALTALALPNDFRDEDFVAITEGQLEAARAVGAKIVGGNLTRANGVHVTTTVLGRAERTILRSGAKIGDGIWIAGAVGLAGLGLRALERGISSAAVEAAITAWRRPSTLFAAARAMAPLASAAIDVSDGLARDAAHVAVASDVRVVFERALLRAYGERIGVTSPAAALGVDAVEAMLHGGEDYALVVASRSEIEGFTRVGSVIAGSGVALDEADI
ncbi:MAG: thiamine-phosphate kinase, partial [Polyangiaceae bacterium]